MEKAVLYVRVSSTEQEREGYSLDAQEALGKEYAAKHQLRIERVWKIQESGWKRQERLKFDEMIGYLQRHKEIPHVIFDITDRMTRNDHDKLKIIDLIELYDKTIHFSRSNKKYDKSFSPDDEFMIDIEVAAAKKLSSDISRKTKMGQLEKARQGIYPSVVPIGYTNNKLTHLIDIDDLRAPFIRKAFNAMATGRYSLSMLAKELYDEGLRSVRGNEIRKSQLSHIFKNPIYYGAFLWQNELYQGNHTPIITKSVFDAVQKVLKGKHHASKTRMGFSFNNLITCGICGCKVSGELKKGKYIYYHCTFGLGRSGHIGRQYLPESQLVSLFGDILKRITIGPDIAHWLKSELIQHNENLAGLQATQLKNFKQERLRFQTRLSRLYDLLLDGKIDQCEFTSKQREYKDQIFVIDEHIANLSRPQGYAGGDNTKVMDRTFELSKNLYPIYLKADNKDKAELVKLILSNCTWDGLTLCPTMKKPFDLMAKGLRSKVWLLG